MRCLYLIALLLLLCASLQAQDSVKVYKGTPMATSLSAAKPIWWPSGYELNGITISAYGFREMRNAPTGINYLKRSLSRFNNTSILSAINATPGVRMEERSPGSYRLNIRGSSLRSPFGVRNVKVYYNDIPFTEPGGVTYLNSLGFYNINSVEIAKGPAGSLYGAGSGSVVLINSPEGTSAAFKGNATVAYTAGSYGLQHAMAEVRLGNGFEGDHTIRYQRLEQAGYRDHTAMKRSVISYDGIVSGQYHADSHHNNRLEAHFLYSDLYYQTPGALTLSEYQQNPRAARPRAGALSGAAEANAAIYQKTFLGGVKYYQELGQQLSNTSVLYGSFVQLNNPTIRNYERSFLPHFGARTTFRYERETDAGKWELLFGGEGQQGFSSIRTYKSLSGVPDTLQTDDESNVGQYFGFAQLGLTREYFSVTVGASINQQRVSFTRFSAPPAQEYKRNFDNGIAPRLALLYKLSNQASVYATISKGFSPPSSAELSPSGGILNTTLTAEKGWNYEIGSKGDAVDSRLQWNGSLFYFGLDNTLAVRKDSANLDYYLNAGATQQYGFEAFVSYDVLKNDLVLANVFLSYTLFDFAYRNFKVYDADYSNKKLPGVAANTLSAGVDVTAFKNWYANATYFYSDRIALNDANSTYANAYHLLGLRIGYRKSFGKANHNIDVFAGVDNLTNQNYSLGNDINAFGGRYYNAAPGRNYYIGFQLRYGHQ